ncbi:MAG: DNA-processing protein DprA [Pseudomonadaceae bacterium]|nr:DNA-processing protein DprA [Pseudomonadaceae bacterium]
MPRPPAKPQTEPHIDPVQDMATAGSRGSHGSISLADYAALTRSSSQQQRRKIIELSMQGGVSSTRPYEGLHEDLAALADYPMLSELVAGATRGLPPMLSEIPDPPLALFCDGDQAMLERPAIAVIGARRASRFGISFAETMGRELAQAGFCVVSGLAYGIDAAAHRGALIAAGGVSGASAAAGATGASIGATVAVLGSGLRHIYPASNRGLATEIRQRGCLVSEYLPFTPPAKHRFPERNRIVSGLSVGVVVVEASERSGSLITARLALEQGRDVFAVPGPPGSELSAGCHRLIRQGAALVTSAQQVLAELPGWATPSAPASQLDASPDVHDQLNDAQREVMLQLSSQPQTFQWLVQRHAGEPSALLSTLASLELAGFVEATVHGYIRRPPR